MVDLVHSHPLDKLLLEFRVGIIVDFCLHFRDSVMDVEEAVVVSVFGTDTVGLGPIHVDVDAEACSKLTLVVSCCLAFTGNVSLLEGSQSGLLLTFAVASEDALFEPGLGVRLDVAGVLTAFSCSLVSKGDFCLLFSSFSAAEVTASVTSTASNTSIGSHRVKFKVLLPPSSNFVFACSLFVKQTFDSFFPFFGFILVSKLV